MIRRTFAAASVLLLIAFVAAAIDQYNQEWRRWQRAYYTELARREDGSVDLLDRLKIETRLGLNKVVTASGRSADVCMTCHLNVGVPGFPKDPLRDLNEIHSEVFVLKELPFEQVGCTACHGGKSLALRSEAAHELMRNRFDEIFLNSVEKLRSPQQMERQEAIERIRWLTGTDFGFAFNAPGEEREQAIERALAWWRLHKDTFLVEGFGERASPFLAENPQARKVAELTALSPAGEPLEFVGSSTCVGCHAQPNPGGAPYIPPSNRKHVERWFKEAFKTSANPEIFLKSHPFLPEALIVQEIEDPERREALLELVREARSAGKLPEPQKVEDLLQLMRANDLTCEACHGPGSRYVRLMTKGLALHYQGRESEAADMLKRAGEIARENARINVGDPEIWGIFERLTAQAEGPQSPAGEIAGE